MRRGRAGHGHDRRAPVLNARALSPAAARDLVAAFLAEDIGRGDVTTAATVDADVRGEAWVEAREPAVVAGLDVARACFDGVAGAGVGWSPQVDDGAHVSAGQRLVVVEADVRTLLTAERTALNLLARLCGIATLTRRFVEACEGTSARITDTRKTTPGLRVLEKYAVRVGGGHNHRFGLDDGLLIKDNHVAAAGGVGAAVEAARRYGAFGLRIEVEVEDLAGLDEAVRAGADVVLLDNMSPELVAEAVQRAGGSVILEASGGMTLDAVPAYARTGVDFISVGALTHAARAADLSLEIGKTWR